MPLASLHVKDLFQRFAQERQEALRAGGGSGDLSAAASLEPLLAWFGKEEERSLLRRVLLDSYFPLGMVERTIFSNAEGMRFFINKRRPELERHLGEELVRTARAFLRVRMDIEKFFDPGTITCIPIDGGRHPLPTDQWCILCGICCEIGGVRPEPPAGTCYPEHWYVYLAGGAVENQQLCPFLFQYFGGARFFCAIHSVKPVACRQFDEEACRTRVKEGGVHRGRSEGRVYPRSQQVVRG
ncbi:MAG: hypothetical protein ACM3MN_09320 [Nitrospirota bacterium]